MLKKAVAIILILFLFILIYPPPIAAQSYEGRGISIECKPGSVTLSPGESKAIQIHINNLSNQTLFIGLEYIATEGFGATTGFFSDEYFPLQPNTTHIAILELTASSGWFHSESSNDGSVEVSWGSEDLPYPLYLARNYISPRNFTMINIEVTRDMTIPVTIFGITFSLSVIVIAIVISKHRKTKEE
jgi:hypothetical protein